MRRAQALTGAALLTCLVAGLAGCGRSTPGSAGYTFNPGDSAVKVDTPQLRMLKARADIAPCPDVAGTESTPGGLPNETLPCLGGGHDVDLAGLRGPLLLNFWSQTCGPCRDESPLLQQFSTTADGWVQVMGVDFYDPRPAYALAFARQLGITYPQLADPDAATKAALHIAGLPITLFVAPSGRVVYTHIGALSSRDQLEQLVREHLGVPVPSGTR